MGLLKKVGSGAKYMLSYRVDRWVGYDILKEQTTHIINIAKHIFKIKTADNPETYEQAMQRLQLNNHDIKQRKKEFTFLLSFYLLLSIVVFTYSVYLGINGNINNFILGFAATIFTLSIAFRYSFWLFQLKHKKLGCTIKEWLDGRVSEE